MPRPPSAMTSPSAASRPGPADMDLGNPLLRPAPWRVNLRVGSAPGQPIHLITTWRSGNATLTAFLDIADVDDLIRRLQAKRADMARAAPTGPSLLLPGRGVGLPDGRPA